MPKFIIPIQWIMTDEIEVVAKNIEEAKRKVENDFYSTSQITGDYLEDSFEINWQILEVLNKLEN